jgi:hypothetical protein
MITLKPPPSSRPISLDSLELLTEDTFTDVSIDLDEGESQKELHLATLQRIGAPAELIQRRAALDAALVTIGHADLGEKAYISFLYFPGEEIIIGFSGAKHEHQGTLVAQMLAKELGYRAISA